MRPCRSEAKWIGAGIIADLNNNPPASLLRGCRFIASFIEKTGFLSGVSSPSLTKNGGKVATMQAETLLDPAGDAHASFAPWDAEAAAINPYSTCAIIQLEGALAHNSKRIDHSANDRDFFPMETARIAIHRLNCLARGAGGQQQG